ncbi:hypothetical protein HYFRA_00003371 [Hymenoscyphus fraxineus]|uniref:Uncharacterized protein n=1 Tax=Hymenoscyphus fraxineus TaxID=746836 RepID=A0A9N9KT98_9HELO|nr:hypothetical protein HYFRA_00003371 [Hymenoscyphus fraxineus]
MCQEIIYTYPSCTHIVKIGTYTCYHARTVGALNQTPPLTTAPSHTSPSDRSSSLKSGGYMTTSTKNKGKGKEKETTPSTLHIASFLHRSAVASPSSSTSPLTISKNTSTSKEEDRPVTIKNLLSKKHEDKVAVQEPNYFSPQCSAYSVVQQKALTGEKRCAKCERRKRAREDVDEDGERSEGFIKVSFKGIGKRRESVRLVDEACEGDDGETERRGRGGRSRSKSRRAARDIVDEVERDTEEVRRLRERELMDEMKKGKGRG